MQPMTIPEIISAVDGTWLNPRKGAAPVTAVCTDSRKIAPGCLFLPWVGERFDGHDFIDRALDAGAAGCLCARRPELLRLDKFYIQVADTRLALGPEHQAAVIETGMNHFGEIRYLGEMVRPDIAVISNIGDAHIEHLGSREGILKAKSEIFENLKPEGLAVLNGDDALLNTLDLPFRTVRCGRSEHCAVRVIDMADHGVAGITCTVVSPRDTYHLTIPAPGEHMAYSAAIAVAVGEELGLSTEEITRGAASYEPAGSRMRVLRLRDGRLVLDDCYNANPQSVTAALEILAKTECGRKVAVLGDMGELGDLTDQAHYNMGALAAMLGIRNVSKSYGDKHLFEGISLKVEGGERIALIGDNGTGKSTLIKMIVGELYPDDGRIKTGPQVKEAYLPQIIRFDHPDWNLVENMMAAKKGLSAQSARNRLAAYDFRGEDVFKPVSVLSGGEQSRLRLCMLMDDEINFLILDEPTNHLDIDSREWIEEAVEAYDGTLLFVSHDRYFINRFATRIWELADGTITDYPCGFAQYRQMKAQEEAEKAAAPKPENEREKPAAERPQRGNKAQQAARRQLTICERDIARAEERIAALEADMEAAACDYEKLNELVGQKDAAQAELDALYERWEQLSEEAEG